MGLITVWDLGFRVECLRFGVQGLLRATEREEGEAYSGLGFVVCDLGLRVEG